MKLIRIFAFIAASVMAGTSKANEYTVDSSAGYTRQWDEYIFRYTPGTGWSQFRSDGNDNSAPGTLQLTPDDGVYGGQIQGTLFFTLALTSSFLSASALGPYLSADFPLAVVASNFAGMDSGVFSNCLNYYGPACDSHSLAVSKNFGDNQNEFIGIDHTLTATTNPFHAPGMLTLDMSHYVDFQAQGLHVYDSNLPAVFGVHLESVVYYTGAEINQVPDAGSALGLTAAGIALAVLARLRHRPKIHRASV